MFPISNFWKRSGTYLPHRVKCYSTILSSLSLFIGSIGLPSLNYCRCCSYSAHYSLYYSFIGITHALHKERRENGLFPPPDSKTMCKSHPHACGSKKFTVTCSSIVTLKLQKSKSTSTLWNFIRKTYWC